MSTTLLNWARHFTMRAMLKFFLSIKLLLLTQSPSWRYACAHSGSASLVFARLLSVVITHLC